jgi:hypothetical protein
MTGKAQTTTKKMELSFWDMSGKPPHAAPGELRALFTLHIGRALRHEQDGKTDWSQTADCNNSSD